MRIQRRKTDNTYNPLTDNMDISERFQEVQKMKLDPALSKTFKRCSRCADTARM